MNSEDLILYPVYCSRCRIRIFISSSKDNCPICKKNDKLIGNSENTVKLKVTTNSTRSDFLREELEALEDCLDTLRLHIKYLVFDLEATRRENEELRKRLEKYEN